MAKIGGMETCGRERCGVDRILLLLPVLLLLGLFWCSVRDEGRWLVSPLVGAPVGGVTS